MEGNRILSAAGEPQRWESALGPLLGAPTGALWRLHSDAVNATLAPFEPIKRLAVVPDEWSIETNELTPSMKLKRRVVEKKYAKEIAEFYADEATAKVRYNKKSRERLSLRCKRDSSTTVALSLLFLHAGLPAKKEIKNQGSTTSGQGTTEAVWGASLVPIHQGYITLTQRTRRASICTAMAKIIH